MYELAWIGLAVSAICLVGYCVIDFRLGLRRRHIYRLYIAGKVSGVEKGNEPLFRDAADTVKRFGYEPVVPHDHVSLEAGWEPAMRKLLPILIDCDGVVLLPGWEGSKGARFEKYVAEGLGIPVFVGTESVPRAS